MKRGKKYTHLPTKAGYRSGDSPGPGPKIKKGRGKRTGGKMAMKKKSMHPRQGRGDVMRRKHGKMMDRDEWIERAEAALGETDAPF